MHPEEGIQFQAPEQPLYPNPNFPNGQHYNPNSQIPVQFPPSGVGPGVVNKLFVDLGHSPLNEVGYAFGSRMLKGQSNEFSKRYSQSFTMLKYYFNVNNSYVYHKLKLLLFPINHKDWKRRILRQADKEVFLPPRDDINAPDLYIPLMAFVTYVLMIGFVLGSNFSFTPEVLGITATSGIAMLSFEVVLIKFGFYLLNSLTVPILDILAYCGYKYVGINITILGGLIFGRLAYYALMIVTSIFMAIFMVRTLRLAFIEGSYGQGNKTRNYFLFGIGVLQLFIQYYLSYDMSRL